MLLNTLRHSNFTSSQIYRLCGSLKNGEPTTAFYTYVKEKMFEAKMRRSLETGFSSQTAVWGNFLEGRVHSMLGMEYEIISKETTAHPTIARYSGSPDFLVKGVKVSELKCYQPKNFASYVTALLTQDLEFIKEEHPAEYWQIVSNAVIQGVDKGEAICYMPYASEMDEIRELCEDPDYLSHLDLQPWQVRFITETENHKLAVLPDDSYFNNLNIFEFVVPQADKDFVTFRVKKAVDLLIL